MPDLLVARDVSKVYHQGVLKRGGVTALEPMSLVIRENEPTVTVVAGESGSGKTTLANLLLGIVRPSSGEMLYRGKDPEKMTRVEHLAFRREVQAIFQDPFESFNPFHKVDRVLLKPVRSFGLAGSADEARALVETALRMVGLRPEDTLGRYPHQLSGGQRQRIMVARALALKPRVIVADEPVSMVDASLRASILESLLRLTRDLRISLVYITHDLTTAYQVGDSAIILYRGAIAEAGSVDRVIKHPQHPYTQLLVDSIPRADPTRRWGKGTVAAVSEDAGETLADACKFAGRCPHVMAVCRAEVPPLFRTDPTRAAACFLYRESPRLGREDLAGLINPPAPVAPDRQRLKEAVS